MSFEVSAYVDERDREQVVGLWNDVFAQDPGWNEAAAMIDQKRKHLPELFLVGRVDDVVVATVVGGYDGVRGWMHHVATSADQRGRGIARSLVAELEQRLRVLGCVKLNLQVREGNPVVSFYEELGYTIEPRVSLGKKL